MLNKKTKFGVSMKTNYICGAGEMTERPKVHAWKACVRHKRTEGSNPSLSANQKLNIN